MITEAYGTARYNCENYHDKIFLRFGEDKILQTWIVCSVAQKQFVQRCDENGCQTFVVIYENSQKTQLN